MERGSSPLGGLNDYVARAPITSTTLALAIVVTVYFLNGADPEVLSMTPAAFGSEPWRLLTSTLAHANVMHIFFNLYMLRSFGPALEQRLSPPLVLALFLTFSIGSAAAQFAVGIGAVGLSGLLYGVFGFMWYGNSRSDRFRGLLPDSTIHILVGWFFICIVATRFGAMNVANVAHGTGCALGWIAGWALLGPMKARPTRIALYSALLGLMLAAGSVWREPLLHTFGDEGYVDYLQGMEEHGGSADFYAAHYDLERALDSEDWRRLEDQADELIATFSRPQEQPAAIARVLYIRAYARMRLDKLELAMADAQEALAIRPDEPGAEEVLNGCREALGR
jgi:membrane associated rhomboid family serine protease